MGLRALGIDPLQAAADVIASPDERYRRAAYARRVALYRDDFESILQEQIGLIFRDEAVRLRLYQLARLSGSSSFLKRVADEVARPIYAQPPRRTVLLPGERAPSKNSADQKNYDSLVKSSQLNGVMDCVARLLLPATHVFLVGRVVEDIGPCLDLLTGDTTYVIAHPQAPTRSVALIYDSQRIVNGEAVRTYIVQDDEVWFEVDAMGSAISTPVPHGIGRKPWVELHRRHRWGSYWDVTTGQDLEVAALQMMVLDAIKLKKHKSQSHIQLAFQGDADAVVKDQTLDEESILMVTGQGNLFPINLEADPSGLLKTAESIALQAAANYGLSLDRLNQKGGGTDDGLQERVAELTQVLRAGEEDVFDLLRALAKASGLPPVSSEARVSVDFGALHHRVDRKTQLEIHDLEEKAGIASPLDPIYEKNPEIETDEEAWAEFSKNLADRAIKIKMLRALNMTSDASADMPGQNAQQNGALGPQVRDGQMSKDDAADAADAQAEDAAKGEY